MHPSDTGLLEGDLGDEFLAGSTSWQSAGNLGLVMQHLPSHTTAVDASLAGGQAGMGSSWNSALCSSVQRIRQAGKRSRTVVQAVPPQQQQQQQQHQHQTGRHRNTPSQDPSQDEGSTPRGSEAYLQPAKSEARSFFPRSDPVRHSGDILTQTSQFTSHAHSGPAMDNMEAEDTSMLRQAEPNLQHLGPLPERELKHLYCSSVQALKDYIMATNLLSYDIDGSNLSEQIHADLSMMIQQISKVCTHAFKPETPEVVEVISKPYCLATTSDWELDRNHWINVIMHLQLGPAQMIAIAEARDKHIEQISVIFRDRAACVDAIAELVNMRAFQGSSSMGPGDHSMMGVLLRHGYLYCARQMVALHRLMEHMQASLVQEQAIVMELFYQVVHRVLSPIQAALYVIESFPFHSDVLALANVIANIIAAQKGGQGGGSGEAIGACASQSPGIRVSPHAENQLPPRGPPVNNSMGGQVHPHHQQQQQQEWLGQTYALGQPDAPTMAMGGYIAPPPSAHHNVNHVSTQQAGGTGADGTAEEPRQHHAVNGWPSLDAKGGSPGRGGGPAGLGWPSNASVVSVVPMSLDHLDRGGGLPNRSGAGGRGREGFGGADGQGPGHEADLRALSDMDMDPDMMASLMQLRQSVDGSSLQLPPGLFSNGLLSNGLFSNGLLSNGVLSNGVLSNELLSNELLSNGMFCGDLVLEEEVPILQLPHAFARHPQLPDLVLPPPPAFLDDPATQPLDSRPDSMLLSSPGSNSFLLSPVGPSPHLVGMNHSLPQPLSSLPQPLSSLTQPLMQRGRGTTRRCTSPALHHDMCLAQAGLQLPDQSRLLNASLRSNSSPSQPSQGAIGRQGGLPMQQLSHFGNLPGSRGDMELPADLHLPQPFQYVQHLRPLQNHPPHPLQNHHGLPLPHPLEAELSAHQQWLGPAHSAYGRLSLATPLQAQYSLPLPAPPGSTHAPAAHRLGASGLRGGELGGPGLHKQNLMQDVMQLGVGHQGSSPQCADQTELGQAGQGQPGCRQLSLGRLGSGQLSSGQPSPVQLPGTLPQPLSSRSTGRVSQDQFLNGQLPATLPQPLSSRSTGRVSQDHFLNSQLPATLPQPLSSRSTGRVSQDQFQNGHLPATLPQPLSSKSTGRVSQDQFQNWSLPLPLTGSRGTWAAAHEKSLGGVNHEGGVPAGSGGQSLPLPLPRLQSCQASLPVGSCVLLPLPDHSAMLNSCGSGQTAERQGMGQHSARAGTLPAAVQEGCQTLSPSCPGTAQAGGVCGRFVGADWVPSIGPLLPRDSVCGQSPDLSPLLPTQSTALLALLQQQVHFGPSRRDPRSPPLVSEHPAHALNTGMELPGGRDRRCSVEPAHSPIPGHKEVYGGQTVPGTHDAHGTGIFGVRTINAARPLLSPAFSHPSSSSPHSVSPTPGSTEPNAASRLVHTSGGFSILAHRSEPSPPTPTGTDLQATPQAAMQRLASLGVTGLSHAGLSRCTSLQRAASGDPQRMDSMARLCSFLDNATVLPQGLSSQLPADRPPTLPPPTYGLGDQAVGPMQAVGLMHPGLGGAGADGGRASPITSRKGKAKATQRGGKGKIAQQLSVQQTTSMVIGLAGALLQSNLQPTSLQPTNLQPTAPPQTQLEPGPPQLGSPLQLQQQQQQLQLTLGHLLQQFPGRDQMQQLHAPPQWQMSCVSAQPQLQQHGQHQQAPTQWQASRQQPVQQPQQYSGPAQSLQQDQQQQAPIQWQASCLSAQQLQQLGSSRPHRFLQEQQHNMPSDQQEQQQVQQQQAQPLGSGQLQQQVTTGNHGMPDMAMQESQF